MAKTSLKIKASRKPKFKVRGYTRCQRCGRPHFRLSEVRHLPRLLPRDGTPRRTPRYYESFLVTTIG